MNKQQKLKEQAEHQHHQGPKNPSLAKKIANAEERARNQLIPPQKTTQSGESKERERER